MQSVRSVFVFTHIKFSFRGAVRHHVDNVCSGAIIRCQGAFFSLRQTPAESRGTGGNGGRSRSQSLNRSSSTMSTWGQASSKFKKEQDGLTGYDRAVCSSPRSPSTSLWRWSSQNTRGLHHFALKFIPIVPAPSHSLPSHWFRCFGIIKPLE